MPIYMATHSSKNANIKWNPLSGTILGRHRRGLESAGNCKGRVALRSISLAKVSLAAATLAMAILALGPAVGRELQPEAGLFPISLSDDLLLEFMQPKAGQDAAATQWSEQHVKQFVQIPGVKAGQFLVASASSGKDKPAFHDLAMYELTADTASKLDTEMQARLQDGRLQKGEELFEPLSSRILYRPLWTAVMARDVPGTDPKPIGAGPLSIHYLFVLSDPATPQQEDAYNSWYDRQHVPDVLRVPGFVSAQRYVRIGGDWQKPRYLVIFKIKTRDQDATNAEVNRRIKQGITKMSPAFGMTPGGMSLGGVYVPSGSLALFTGLKR